MHTPPDELPEQSAADEHRAVMQAISGLLLALASVATFVGWHLTHSQPTSLSSSLPAVIASAPSPASPPPLPTVYLAGSPEHAAALESSMDEANLQRQILGDGPLRFLVVVIDPDGAAASDGPLWDHARFSPNDGLPIHVVDLRAAISQ